MKTIDLILFDMDGTMFDTEQIWFEVFRDLLKDMDHPGPPELYFRAAGTGGEIERRLFAELLGLSDEDSYSFVKELYRRGSETLLTCFIPKKPGLDAMMQFLRESGLRWTIVSSSPRYLIDRYLSLHGIDPPEEPIVDVSMIRHSKPSPEPYLIAAGLCGTDPARCLVVEDAHTGVSSALAAGMSVIMVPDINEPTDEERRRTVAVIEALDDVIPFLQDLCL